MRILFEATRVFKNPEINVGISRVIRNIAANLHHCEDIEAIPILLRRQVIYDASKIALTKDRKFFLYKANMFLKRKLQNISQEQEKFYSISQHRQVKVRYVLCQFVTLMTKIFVTVCLKICRTIRIKSTFARLSVIHIQPGDIVVLTGTVLDPRQREFLQMAKAKGARIIVLVYDLFQITMPELLRENTQRNQVIPTISNADGLVSISTTVNNEVKQYLQKHRDYSTVLPWMDYFYLGSELDMIDKKGESREFVKNILTDSKSVYVIVGTISPHKNHVYALDAFELLWGKGLEVSLCIIGTIGWKCDQLLDRIRSHPQWEKQLFLIHDANDTELAFCYRHAKALVLPSLNEGFGLPLVESMQFGLPVMASDIPIFRELGENFVAFFDLSDPHILCDLIRKYEVTSIFPASKPIEQWKWISWKESTRQLISCIDRHERGVRENSCSLEG